MGADKRKRNSNQRYTQAMKRRSMPPAKSTPVRTTARPAAAQQIARGSIGRGDEADIAVSERLIQRERPIPLAKVLQEFGRAPTRKLDR
jgi:hypothetical protein